MPRIVVLLFTFFHLLAAAEPIRIGIFSNQEFPKATFIAKNEYQLFADNVFITSIHAGEVADVSNVAGQLSIWFKGKAYKTFSKVEFKPLEKNAEFKVQLLGHKSNTRIFPDKLEITCRNGSVVLVNEVELEKYIAGVIEAEAGRGENLEYYKVQAVISRTYALNNKRRHEAESFHLCDATHCQVYHGMPRFEDLAVAAVAETKDLVIVDSDINLITAAFHSNCGGNTANAETVWSKPLPYLVSCTDTFCRIMPNARWQKNIAMPEWLDYLSSQNLTHTDSTFTFTSNRALLSFTGGHTVSLPGIRNDLKLKSTCFSVHENGNKVLISGRGFGHGVGLCQEGAMRMSQLEYTFSDIIHFYYKSVHIIPRTSFDFFRDTPLDDIFLGQ